MMMRLIEDVEGLCSSSRGRCMWEGVCRKNGMLVLGRV